MGIEARINLDAPDGFDVSQIISEINAIISSMNGQYTQINVAEVDNPMSLSPISLKDMGGRLDE